jgi:D-alanine-D-alanine ligase
MDLDGLRVGLVFGGRSVEHRVSVLSARTVAGALAAAGFEVVPLGIAQDGMWTAPEESVAVLDGRTDEVVPSSGAPAAASLAVLAEAKVEVVFPLVHGTWGEDGTLQGLCEMADLPYVGAGVAASAVAMDKLLCKRLLESVGLPVVEYVGATRLEVADDGAAVEERALRLGMPVFVKPSVGGSSVGVTKVRDRAELGAALEQALKLSESALIERAVAGRELECSVLGYPRLSASAVGEIRPGREFYDYRDKYLEDGAELMIPALLEAKLEARVRALAVDAFAAIGGCGMARVDFLLEGADLYVNEVNTIPGFTSISMYPKLWQEAGVRLEELVRRLVADAIVRHRDRAELDRAISSFLRSLSAPE